MTQKELFDTAVGVATSKGFAFYDKCQCGGNLRYNYKRSGLYLEILYYKSLFLLKHDNKHGAVIVSGNYNQLEQALNDNIS